MSRSNLKVIRRQILKKMTTKKRKRIRKKMMISLIKPRNLNPKTSRIARIRNLQRTRPNLKTKRETNQNRNQSQTRMTNQIKWNLLNQKTKSQTKKTQKRKVKKAKKTRIVVVVDQLKHGLVVNLKI